MTQQKELLEDMASEQQRINKYVKERNEEQEKAQKQSQPNKSIQRPNIDPSSTYNFKK